MSLALTTVDKSQSSAIERRKVSVLLQKVRSKFRLVQHSKTFRFLDLPAEIRNEIYRLLLSYEAQNNCSPNSKYHFSDYSLDPPDREDGSIHCQNIWTRKKGIEVALLRVSRQVHEKASYVFAAKNCWFHVKVNKNKFAQDLKWRGFAVVCDDSKGPYPGPYPLVTIPLHITIVLKDLESSGENSQFIMPVSVFEDWARALRCMYSQKGFEVDVTVAYFTPILPPSVQDWMFDSKYWLNGVPMASGHVAEITGFSTADLHPERVLSILEGQLTIHRSQSRLNYNLWDLAERLERCLAFFFDICRKFGRGVLYDFQESSRLDIITATMSYALLCLYIRLQQWKQVTRHSCHMQALHLFLPSSKAHILILRAKAHQALGYHRAALLCCLYAKILDPGNENIEQLAKSLRRQVVRRGLPFKYKMRDVDEHFAKFRKEYHDCLMKDLQVGEQWIEIRCEGEIAVTGPPDVLIKAQGLEEFYPLTGRN